MKKSKKAIYEIFEKIEKNSGIYEVKMENFSLYEKIRVDIQNQFISDEVYIKGGFFFKKKTTCRNWEVPEKIDVLTIGFEEFAQEQLFRNFDKELKGKTTYSLLLESDLKPNINNFKENTIRHEAIKFSPEEEMIMENFENLIREELGSKSNIKVRMLKAKKEFLSENSSIGLFLDKFKVEKVILVKGYRNKVLMYIAKKKQIPVIEVQYANISDFHGGFSTWYKGAILADELLVWTNYYKESLQNYDGKIVVSLPNYLRKVEVYKEEQIVVIVQSYYIKQFEELIENLWSSNPKKKIILIFKKNVILPKGLKKLVKKKRIAYVFKERKEVIDLMKKSKWIVSGYSTALVESNLLGSVPLVYKKISNSFEFDSMIKNGEMLELKKYNVDEYVKVNRIKL